MSDSVSDSENDHFRKSFDTNVSDTPFGRPPPPLTGVPQPVSIRTKARQLPLAGLGHFDQCIWGFARFRADYRATNRGTRWHPETANLGQNRLRLSKRGDVVPTRPAMEVVASWQFAETVVFASFGDFCQ